MKNRFEYRINNLLLTNGILFLIAGIVFASSKGIQNWQPYAWWFGSIIWIYRYFSYQINGFLRIDSSQIQINHANWKGIEKINEADIKTVDFKSKAFIVNLKGGKKIKIHKGNLVKESISVLEEVLNSLYEKQTFHNKT